MKSKQLAAKRKAGNCLRKSQGQYAAAVQYSPIGIFIFSLQTKCIFEANTKFQQMLGYCAGEIPRLTVYDLYWDENLFNSDLELIERNNLHEAVNRTFKRKNGEYIEVKFSTCWAVQGNQKVVVAHVEDVTERNRIREELFYLARYDPLTNVPNRKFFEETIAQTFAGENREGTLLLVDIDNFKLLNDTLGHLIGDQILVNTAAVLQRHLPAGILLARSDSDEFAILLKGMPIEAAKVIAEQLRAAVEAAKLNPAAGNMPLGVTVSIGIAPLERGLTASDLLAHADYLLYRAKQRGSNLVVAPESGSNVKDRLDEATQLLKTIRDALRDGRMVLYFQPVVNTDSKQIIYHEGLLRLVEEDGRVVSPESFIPIAEQFGIMPLIDRQVIKLAFAALTQYRDLRLFVNISGVSVGDATLLNLIEKNISASGIDPKRLGFEITETAAVRDIPQAESWLCKLRAKGCKFALDDFGRGFSSFSYLQQLPVDFVKIDGSFVRDLDSNERHRVLVQAINQVVNSLGQETIAEFVENDRIASILRGYQVANQQGYYLGKPEPVPRGEKLDKKSYC